MNGLGGQTFTLSAFLGGQTVGFLRFKPSDDFWGNNQTLFLGTCHPTQWEEFMTNWRCADESPEYPNLFRSCSRLVKIDLAGMS